MKIKVTLLFLFVCSIGFGQETEILKTYSAKQLNEDFDLMVSALKEAHPGLYWYISYADFEKIFQQNRNKIKDGMNSYEFYRLVSNVVAADKEGHSRVFSSKDIGDFFHKKAKFLPFGIKTINEKIYLTNDIDGRNTKGKIIAKINNQPIDSILNVIFQNTSQYSDGYSITGKYKNIDGFSFAGYYVDFVSDFKSDKASVELLNPINNTTESFTVNLVNRDDFVKIAKRTVRKKRKNDDRLYALEIKEITKTAILTFNSFHYNRYKKQKLEFTNVVDSLFRVIKKYKCKNLIIDIRNNSGGSEGAEDNLFSYLTDKPYKKYKYVQSNGFTYSFLKHTDYKDASERLEKMLNEEHSLRGDGRILRKDNVLPTELPKKKPFKGDLYVLISGKTYSGGSEFASIAKSNSNAIFIGEETGGGFYGQTSGSYVFLILPNTQIEIRIPLLKFATTFESKDIPFGHGVIPNHKVVQSYEDFIKGIDTEMEFTLKLIENKK